MVKARELRPVATVILALALFFSVTAVHADPQVGAWAKLTPEQKSILAPLQPDWDKLDAERRKHWIGMATRYPSLPPERQQRIQQRIHEWAALTPQQRAQAIERYKRLKQLPPEKHDQLHQRWREYQELPEEQRQKLREGHAPAANPSK